MQLQFYKYQGTGNDFVMVDDRAQRFPVSKELIEKLCNRRFGIGADGLILLQNHPQYDFKMVYFNADGNQSSMCGNGGRCLVQFAHDLGIIGNSASFEAVDGLHEAYLRNGLVELKMIDVTTVEQHADFSFLNTGSPHYVAFVEGLPEYNVYAEGKKIRNNERFGPAGGTNVNFVELLPDHTLAVRTYERGVEDETYSCGTGVTACAIVASYRELLSPVHIQTVGGKLQVAFKKQAGEVFTDIFLIGPAQQVFKGTVEL
jgi:diaminopimelate epimerase